MRELPQITDATICAIIAPVRSGKTHLLTDLILQEERTLVIDKAIEFQGPEYEHYYGSGQLPLLLERLEANPYYFRCVYHIGTDEQNEFRVLVQFFWHIQSANNKKRLPSWLVIDECVDLCRSGSPHRQMDFALRYGRKILLGIIAGTQRIAEIDKILTTNADTVILFYTTEVLDLEAIEKRFGEEVRLKVENLRPLKYDDVSKVVHQTPQCLVYHRPSKSYKILDLGPTPKGEKTCASQDVQRIPGV